MNTTKLLDRRPEEVIDDLLDDPLLGNAVALADATAAAAEIETILEEGEHRACDWRVWDPDCPPAIPARTTHDEEGIIRLRALRARVIHLIQDRLAGCRLTVHRGRVVPAHREHHEQTADHHRWMDRRPEEIALELLDREPTITRQHARALAAEIRELLELSAFDPDDWRTWDEDVHPDDLTRDADEREDAARLRDLRHEIMDVIGPALERHGLEVYRGRVIDDQSSVRTRLRAFPNVMGDLALEGAQNLWRWAGAEENAKRATTILEEVSDLIDREDMHHLEGVLESLRINDREAREWSPSQRAAAERMEALNDEAAEALATGPLSEVHLTCGGNVARIRPAGDILEHTADLDRFEEVEVNDHGNVTYSVLDIAVWACV